MVFSSRAGSQRISAISMPPGVETFVVYASIKSKSSCVKFMSDRGRACASPPAAHAPPGPAHMCAGLKNQCGPGHGVRLLFPEQREHGWGNIGQNAAVAERHALDGDDQRHWVERMCGVGAAVRLEHVVGVAVVGGLHAGATLAV